jgi:hypothetical protein
MQVEHTQMGETVHTTQTKWIESVIAMEKRSIQNSTSMKHQLKA